jgi:Domain of unknown function (DUF4276)
MFISVGLLVEGRTDVSFLQPIIEKTLSAIAYDCSGQIDTSIVILERPKKSTPQSPAELILDVSKTGWEKFAINILCVHSDADDRTSTTVFQTKITPAREALLNLSDEEAKEYCTCLVAIVPIQESEAWMLVDKALLKDEIGTIKSDGELQINRAPEMIASPKEVIEKAIRIARQNAPARRRGDLTISDLYAPIGQRLDLDKLRTLSAYQAFEAEMREAFRHLNLLHK